MLHICATPIGNLDDVTPRVLATLRAVDLIAAEDTRLTRKLLSRFDIHTPLTSLFAHNEAEKSARVLALLRRDKDVALVTDAGMPGISDPGVRLVALAVNEALPLTVVPGPSAVTTALVASGLGDGGGFRFVGYLPRRAPGLRAALEAWRRHGGVIVAFETARRLATSLNGLAEQAPAAAGAVCRELTKLHEEVARGSLEELAARFTADAATRGEITLVIDLGPPLDDAARADSAAREAAAALIARGLSHRDAAGALTVCLGLPANRAKRIVAVAGRGGR